MNFHIESPIETLEKEAITDFQTRWEFLKYVIKILSIKCSKLEAQNTKKEIFFFLEISSKN